MIYTYEICKHRVDRLKEIFQNCINTIDLYFIYNKEYELNRIFFEYEFKKETIDCERYEFVKLSFEEMINFNETIYNEKVSLLLKKIKELKLNKKLESMGKDFA